MKLQLDRLRSGFTADQSRLATDSALVGLGSLLVVVPGLVTTAAGLLLLLPPSRAAARPVLSGAGRPRLRPAHPADPVAGVGPYPPAASDYIDGEVIDVADVTEVVEPPALPLRPE